MRDLLGLLLQPSEHKEERSCSKNRGPLRGGGHSTRFLELLMSINLTRERSISSAWRGNLGLPLPNLDEFRFSCGTDIEFNKAMFIRSSRSEIRVSSRPSLSLAYTDSCIHWKLDTMVECYWIEQASAFAPDRMGVKHEMAWLVH